MQLRDLEEEFSNMKARINVLEQFCFKNVSWKVLMEYSTDLVLARAKEQVVKQYASTADKNVDYEMVIDIDDQGSPRFCCRPYYNCKSIEPPFVVEMRAEGVPVLWEPEPGVW